MLSANDIRFFFLNDTCNYLFFLRSLLVVLCYCYFINKWNSTWRFYFPYNKMLALFNSNTTSVTCGTGVTPPFGAKKYSPVICWVRVSQSFVFYVMLCRSLFVLFLWTVVLFVLLRIRTSDCPYGIFTLFSSSIVFVCLSFFAWPLHCISSLGLSTEHSFNF